MKQEAGLTNAVSGTIIPTSLSSRRTSMSSHQPPTSRPHKGSLLRKVKAVLSSFRKKKLSKEVKRKAVPPDTGPTEDLSQQVYIRIRRADLRLDIEEPTGSDHVYLIQGSFQDISQHSGITVDWVIKIAHLMCDPLGAGRIFTHTHGVPLYYYYYYYQLMNLFRCAT